MNSTSVNLISPFKFYNFSPWPKEGEMVGLASITLKILYPAYYPKANFSKQGVVYPMLIPPNIIEKKTTITSAKL